MVKRLLRSRKNPFRARNTYALTKDKMNGFFLFIWLILERMKKWQQNPSKIPPKGLTNTPISRIVISLRLHLKKGRAFGGKRGYKSGSVSLPRFFQAVRNSAKSYTILCGRQSEKSWAGLCVNNIDTQLITALDAPPQRRCIN